MTHRMVNLVERKQTMDSPGGEKARPQMSPAPPPTPQPLDLLTHTPAPEGESGENSELEGADMLAHEEKRMPGHSGDAVREELLRRPR